MTLLQGSTPRYDPFSSDNLARGLGPNRRTGKGVAPESPPEVMLERVLGAPVGPRGRAGAELLADGRPGPAGPTPEALREATGHTDPPITPWPQHPDTDVRGAWMRRLDRVRRSGR